MNNRIKFRQYRLGNEWFDSQHQELFTLIDYLQESIDEKDQEKYNVIQKMFFDKFDKHCKREESLMNITRFAGAPDHIAHHQLSYYRMETLSQPRDVNFSTNDAILIGGYVRDHIDHGDREFSDFVINSQLSDRMEDYL